MNSMKHILWVDDEVDLLKPHIIFLENKGYKVSTVYSGEEAIEKCQEINFDLVLMDDDWEGNKPKDTRSRCKSAWSENLLGRWS